MFAVNTPFCVRRLLLRYVLADLVDVACTHGEDYIAGAGNGSKHVFDAVKAWNKACPAYLLGKIARGNADSVRLSCGKYFRQQQDVGTL